jgi:queuosine precursor transporter
MLNVDISLTFLQSLNPIWISALIFTLSIIFLLIFFRFFGEAGLITYMVLYMVLSVLISNIQVLKAVQFPFFSDPIALGTIVILP